MTASVAEARGYMAQGCILPFTRRDSAALRRSLDDPIAQRTFRDATIAFNADNADAFRRAVSYPLTDPKHPAHKVFMDVILKNVAENESIDHSYKSALPKAIVEIARLTPNIMGLVQPARGVGSTALRKNLVHKRVGDAFAYELLGTAALIRKTATEKLGSKSSNGANSLSIFPTDRVDLGVRFQADYGFDGKGHGLHRPASRSIHSPRQFRRSFEADLLIHRKDEAGSFFAVGVDFKHTRHYGAYKGSSTERWSQIKAIANGIMTGDIDEYHFVTNGHFHQQFRNDVDHMNRKLMESDPSLKVPPIGMHERVQYPLS